MPVCFVELWALREWGTTFMREKGAIIVGAAGAALRPAYGNACVSLQMVQVCTLGFSVKQSWIKVLSFSSSRYQLQVLFWLQRLFMGLCECYPPVLGLGTHTSRADRYLLRLLSLLQIKHSINQSMKRASKQAISLGVLWARRCLDRPEDTGWLRAWL